MCSNKGQIVGKRVCACIYILSGATEQLLWMQCVCTVCGGRKLMCSVVHINIGKKISHFSTAIWAGVTLIITGKIRVYIYLLLLYLFPIGTVIILPCSNFFLQLHSPPCLSYGWLVSASLDSNIRYIRKIALAQRNPWGVHVLIIYFNFESLYPKIIVWSFHPTK